MVTTFMSFTGNLTRSLLSVVGSPFKPLTDVNVDDSLSSLCRYAAKNRMALLCLDSLDRRGILVPGDYYEKLSTNYSQALRLMVRVSEVFEKSAVDYAFFKSLRPYREATVDVDVLALSSAFWQALEAMYGAGFLHLETGPLSATFREPSSGLNVDIYDEIGVSHLIYLDKDKLSKCVVSREVSDGHFVKTLSPAADLLALMAHSVLKEQMYVLSEYYTTLFCLHADDGETVLASLKRLAEECSLGFAVETHLGVTASLHKEVHGFAPRCIQRMYGELQHGSWEFSRVKRLGLSFPLKYHPLTVVQALAGLLKELKGRRGIAVQASRIFDPRFCLRFTTHLLHHIMRETY